MSVKAKQLWVVYLRNKLSFEFTTQIKLQRGYQQHYLFAFTHWVFKSQFELKLQICEAAYLFKVGVRKRLAYFLRELTENDESGLLN